MGSHLGPLLANAFLAYHEQNYPLEYTPLQYRQYFNVMFVLFKSSDHLTLSRQRSILNIETSPLICRKLKLKRFPSYLNSCHVNMLFTIETEQRNKISFLDVNVIR